MSDPAVFNRLKNADIATIHDDVEGAYWWLLRSLPAIRRLDFETFTYPTSWRTLNTGGQFQSYTDQYAWLDHDYLVLGEIESNAFRDDLVVITNEYYESETQYSIDHLVSRYSSLDETLIVVTDSKRFIPRGGQRPLYQEQSVERIGSYRRLYNAYNDVYTDAGWDFPLIDTKNLFLQDNANLYHLVSNDRVTTTKELFEVLPEAPYLPLYDVFGEIFAREDEYGSVPLSEEDVTGLQRWLRRRVEWEKGTAQEVAEFLNQAVTRDGQTFDPSYAARSPAVRDARVVGDSLNPNDSSIDKRYRVWLQRGGS